MIPSYKDLSKNYHDLRIKSGLQEKEIYTQIQKRKLAEQTRNWTIILVILIHIALWLF